MADLPKKSWLAKGQLWVGVLLVFGIQLGSIFWLGARRLPQQRPPAPSPAIQMVRGAPPDLLALMDPTLFALPHEQGFSGPGWLIPPVQEIQPFAWSEPPRWLGLPVAALGVSPQSAGADRLELLPAPERPEPEPFLPVLAPSRPFREKSTLRTEGDLADRRLVSAPELPSWPHADLVNNSVVQLLVDAEGVPLSVTLLERSGDADADTFAVKEARKARFETAPRLDAARLKDLVWGTLIFEWHTVPVNPEARAPGAKK